ncbi:hypothetical protein GCM10017778_70540 [Streptomyces vinaceus]|nr:hypothetical protein GCM10017778_70540 [Streptomyces vinaceus]
MPPSGRRSGDLLHFLSIAPCRSAGPPSIASGRKTTSTCGASVWIRSLLKQGVQGAQWIQIQ